MAINATLFNQLELEKREKEFLATYAVKSESALRLMRTNDTESKPAFRTEFQRDRDRIIHSRAFRRLKQKTQVFMPDEGDHLRTRLSHTLEVSQLGRTLTRSLGLNEDLVEAIALAHDLGHTPFGHSGEEILHKIMSGEENLDGQLPKEPKIQWEGFKHNHQSLRIVDLLEYKYDHPGLNLTHFVREGILRHTQIHFKTGAQKVRYQDLDYKNLHLDLPLFLEGQVVALVDEIAQHTHDLEDGLRAQVVTFKEVMEQVALCKQIVEGWKSPSAKTDSYQNRNRLIHDLIHFLMSDLLQQSFKNIQKWSADLPAEGFKREWIQNQLIDFSSQGKILFEALALFVISKVIHCQEVDRHDARAAVVIPTLFKMYLQNPKLLPDYLLDKISANENLPPIRMFSTTKMEEYILELKSNIRFLRSICDYIAGMTDSFAIKEFQMMVYPNIER